MAGVRAVHIASCGASTDQGCMELPAPKYCEVQFAQFMLGVALGRRSGLAAHLVRDFWTHFSHVALLRAYNEMSACKLLSMIGFILL